MTVGVETLPLALEVRPREQLALANGLSNRGGPAGIPTRTVD